MIAETSIATSATVETPGWRCVRELEDLVEIFDPNLQVCTWRRGVDPAISQYLAELNAAEEFQAIERLSADSASRIHGLPDDPGRAALIEDLSLLRDVVCELLGFTAVGLRLARIDAERLRHAGLRALAPGFACRVLTVILLRQSKARQRRTPASKVVGNLERLG